MEQYDFVGNDFSETERDSFATAQIGTYFIIPLRTVTSPISSFRLTEIEKKLIANRWLPYDWAYEDLYDRINKIFCHTDSNICYRKPCVDERIGLNYQLSIENAMTHFNGAHSVLNEDTRFFVYSQEKSDDMVKKNTPFDEILAETFRLRCVQIMVMHSGIGFLIVGIEANNPKVYDMLLCSGYNTNHCMLGVIKSSDEKTKGIDCITDDRLNFGDFIRSILCEVELTDYSDCIGSNKSNLLLRDTTAYSVMVLDKRIHEDNNGKIGEKIGALCLNIRAGQMLGTPTVRKPDSRAYSMFAAPSIDNDKQWLRWGIYTTFERTAQLIMNELSAEGEKCNKIDAINVNADNREDNYLPFLLLSLYARYSYLFFSELLGKIDENDNVNMSWLETQMLHLKASGTFIAGDMSPYDNVNDFLRYQHIIYEIDDSQKLIDSKISIISHKKAEKADKRNRNLEKFLTVFGIISILCDSVGLCDAMINTPEYRLIHILLCGGEIVALIIFVIILNLVGKR